MSRTRLLQTALLALILWLGALSPPAASEIPIVFTDGILSGDVTDTGAIIWTRTSAYVITRVEYGTSAALGRVSRDFVPAPPDVDRTVNLELTGLQPGTRYYYRVVAEAGRASAASLVGSFRTAPAWTDAAEVTFIWSGDMSERFKPYRIFEPMRAAAPDFFLFLGDTVYAYIDANARTLDEFRAIHLRNRDDDAFHRFARSTSIYAIWDDHEVFNNFDRTHRRMHLGRQAFTEHWPIRLHSANPARLYRSFRWGSLLEVFILDTRQYRSPSSQRDDEQKTMLGAAQKEWLKRGFAASTATFKVIATSVALKYHGPDSWEGYRTERDELFDFIARSQIRGVVFLAADVHYAAVLRHRQGFVESYVGPLAMVITRERAAAGQPETEFSSSSGFTFGLVRVSASALVIEIYDVDGRLLHRTTVQP